MQMRGARSISVIFLGGNGHSDERLDLARAAIARRASIAAEGLAAPPAPSPEVTITSVRYPGFEGRPRAENFEAFLDVVLADIRRSLAAMTDASALLYATGIGGLFALCLRARGELLDTPILLQAPVLWGLERRLMPKLMRFGLAQRALPRLFASRAFQARFARKQFESPLAEPTLRAFFDGYARCAALPDFFAWLTPALLRRLEADFAERPGALCRVAVWWGERDSVVSLDELRFTSEALDVRWPLRVFPAWGHYPMIDDPEGWVSALPEALALFEEG
jgi:pimeloyl-ACP methyl ester carboxylesterase